MLQKVLSFIEEKHMLDGCEHIVAGVSGGADSVCLLLVLEEIQKRYGIPTTVVHIEHGIRGKDSIKDAEFVEKLCGEKNIPFYLFSYKVGKIANQTGESVEEAGRRLRYEAFAKIAGEYKNARIAVAHHKNDNAETMLLNLARGSNLKGLGGIPPVRGEIIRPLLCVDRKEIEEFLKEKGQEFCTDQSNFETVYARNKIRHGVLPVLKQINPRALEHMADAADTILQMQQYLDDEAKRAMEHCATENVKEEKYLLIKEELERYPELLQKEMIYKVIGMMAKSKKDITREHVNSVYQLFAKQVGKSVDLPYGGIANRVYEGVSIQKKKQDENTAFEINEKEFSFDTLENCGKIAEIPKKKYTKWFDYDKIRLKLQIRTRQTGDYFLLEDSLKKKSLKSYFIDEKVPKEKRDQVLLLADGNHIIWIVGYRISAYYKVTDTTKRILQVQFNGGKEHE